MRCILLQFAPSAFLRAKTREKLARVWGICAFCILACKNKRKTRPGVGKLRLLHSCVQKQEKNSPGCGEIAPSAQIWRCFAALTHPKHIKNTSNHIKPHKTHKPTQKRIRTHKKHTKHISTHKRTSGYIKHAQNNTKHTSKRIKNIRGRKEASPTHRHRRKKCVVAVFCGVLLPEHIQHISNHTKTRETWT